METMTISQLSKRFDVSTRMLRYYEKMGLLASHRKEDYAYRMYDEIAVRRLQQIIVLRKLHIPLKQIALIFEDKEQVDTLNIFQENINEIEDEINALSTIRDILNVFVSRLSISLQNDIRLDLLEDRELIKVVDTLCLSKLNLKEERSMNELNKANETLNKNLEVRMVLLPPCTVASFHYVGENPEEVVGNQMSKFVQESKIYERKPDARMFGFNHPNPSEDREFYGYEDLITIPEDMEVPAPLTKKRFNGGLYAAHTITFPNFNEWADLAEWVQNSDKYEVNYSELGEEIMGGCLEEHLNWIYSAHMGWPENGIDGQLDLLLPVKLLTAK
ncbi:DNA-binding transcriptional regulator, MerR family [Anaerosporobacter mobilis DSM 15930]|jgi:DNA-binding transcriptional MerR regulator/DNA gyrase inhibitor GyrI|uniref:DNA-binding transcriptional regulator, MerR family n=1 Tax=Anaerosporobacter mobilis DSM 15930 TaxID=1120996 RepID=A0A1M7MH84_9FIRM|nr:effector binding domain-containing protein [Anaerosporobacter mobilis]SHM90180.1 DNA-binding transcriptional regulator, MerR family [Anaerosporobacter mobilis DSM 15930]